MKEKILEIFRRNEFYTSDRTFHLNMVADEIINLLSDEIKTYSYAQYVKLIDEGENGDNYKPIKLKDRPALVWIHVNDIEQYNIRDDRQE